MRSGKGQGRERNGHGTVYQEGAKTGTPIGFWIAELQWSDETGRARRRSARRRTQREADNALDRFRLELASKRTIATASARRGPTFKEYATKWLSQRKISVRPSTYRQYESNATIHLIPFFGHARMRQLGKDDVLAYVSSPKPALRKTERRDGTAVRKQCLKVLGMIFRSAEDDGVIDRIPFRTTGHNKVAVKHDPDEIVFLDEAQQHAFMRACSGRRLEALFILALATGAREGELLGLRWRDVGDDHVVISCRLDQVTRKREATKTRAARRFVDVPLSVIAALGAHRKRMQKEGLGTTGDDLIFVNTLGKPISVTNMVKREFRPISKAAKLPDRVTFHSLRHSHAALCLARGVNVIALQKRLGHESPSTTLRFYGHLLPTSQREASNAVAGLFSNIVSLFKSPTKSPTAA